MTSLGGRTVASGLGGDEMVAVGSAESEQAARDKTENFDLPCLGPVARAALPYGDDQIAPAAMAGGITLLAAECVAPPLLRVGLRPVHPFAEAPLVTFGDQLPFHWRGLKQLQRRHLATFGLSNDACNPRVRESFAERVEQSRPEPIRDYLRRRGSAVFRLLSARSVCPNAPDRHRTANPGLF